MRNYRQSLGGLGNMMFLKAYAIARCLDGQASDMYLQSTTYWSGYEKEIKQFFSENIGFIDKVALHIRRGDYVKADNFHVDLSKTNYYQDAVKHFPESNFLVFCKDNQGKEQDIKDREWVKDFLSFIPQERWEFAPPESNEIDDMNMMASCKHLIGANSSFSWWAAFLNQHNGTKIFPKQWFVDNVQRTELLPEWLLL